MYNYHTHTYRCKHATGEVAEYAAEAVKGGCKVLGISDHIPFPDGRWDWVRMSPEELPGYIAAIEEARRQYPDLRILKALECEYEKSLDDYFREIRERWALDYLVGGIHWVPFRGEWIDLQEIDTAAKLRAYADYAVETMESGLFAFLAHPDGYGYGYLQWDRETEAASRDILTAAQELKVPLEINGLGFRKKPINTPRGERAPYPLPEFWRLAAEYEVTVTANSDAHAPEEVLASLDLAEELAGRWGLSITDPLAVTAEEK